MEKLAEVSSLIFINILRICSSCLCRNVLTSKSCHLFSDKDLCKSVSHGCEHVCVNSGDSYICKCHDGFLLREDGKTCRSKQHKNLIGWITRTIMEASADVCWLPTLLFADKDICNSVDHGCEQVCVNTEDSYICQCHEKFVLKEDGKTCRCE